MFLYYFADIIIFNINLYFLHLLVLFLIKKFIMFFNLTYIYYKYHFFYFFLPLPFLFNILPYAEI